MKENITIRYLEEKDIYKLYQEGYTTELPEWKKWNGPYFEDYESFSCFEDFKKSEDYTLFLKENVKGIFVNDQVVGVVTRHWENEKTRWLEVGIVIYSSDGWNLGIGTIALKLWIEEIFSTVENLQHIGLTTWSGNKRMMKVAEKVGMQKEAQIRKVRFWQGVFYDSIKYGILKDEWETSN